MSGADSFGNIFRVPELKRRILFTLALLVVYRIGAHIPTPGINSVALAELFARASGTILGFFDMFSGGALSRLTIFALGIMPYISSSIILQLMTIVSPHLAKLKKEGEQGQKKITQYTRYGTVVLSLIQGSGIAVGLEAMKSPSGGLIVHEPGWSFRMMTVLTLTAGTCFLMWLGEQITERGIGNGISLIIFSGIVAGTPAAILQSLDLMGTGEMSVLVMLFLLVVMIFVVGVIVFTEGGQRRIPIQYAKRAFAFEGQYIGGYPADFCFIHHHVSSDHCSVYQSSVDAVGFGHVDPRNHRVQHDFCGSHILLLLFLYGRHFQPG